MNILIADTELNDAKDVQHLLAGFGYENCVTVNSSTGVLAAYSESPPELILISIKLMEEMSDSDFFTSHLSRPNSLVVIMTEKESEEQIAGLATDTPTCFFQKPIEEKELKIAVQMVTQLSKLDVTRRQVEFQQNQLNQLNERLLHPADLEDKLKLTTEGIVDIFKADFARIWLVKPGDRCDSGCRHALIEEGPHRCRLRDQCLHLMASSGRYTHIDSEIHSRIPFGSYKIGRIASQEEQKFLINDVTTDPQVHDTEWAKSIGLASFAGYRLLSKTGHPIGVLALFSKKPIALKENSMLEGIANNIAYVIQASVAENALMESEVNYKAVVNNAYEGICVIQDQRLKYFNRKMLEILDFPPESEKDTPFYEYIHPDDRKTVIDRNERRLRGDALDPVYALRIITWKKQTKWLEVKPVSITWKNESANLVFQADITDRKNAEEERERLINELKEALENVKKLSGLVPICANCKKIRDDTGYWNELEAYIELRSDALFSHGICPDCADDLYGEKEWYKKNRSKLQE